MPNTRERCAYSREEPPSVILTMFVQWIATSTAMFIAHALLADPSESYSMASLLNTYVFHLVLVPNPDGYVYTWDTDRLWYVLPFSPFPVLLPIPSSISVLQHSIHFHREMAFLL